MEECYKALYDQLDWNNPKGDRFPFDLSKPPPLKGHPGRLTIPSEYFFNKDLENLKSSDLEKKYITSITKTKAARYELVGIEDMIPSLWSLTKKILSMVSVKINKLHGYGHLEEIVLFNLEGSDTVDLAVALCMFTRSLIIRRRVEDVQLGLESYQKKLNLTKPQQDFLEISAKELYTPSFDPPGAVYEDLNKQKRVIRADELYKFSDGTLKMGERRIIRNLERLVGARELEMDYRLMQRTI
ncbi:hypothetical protein Tco_0308675 [Tanacetum coccineum]